MNINFVLKRDGSTEEFNSEKIKNAIEKAMKSIKIRSKSLSTEITESVLEKLEEKEEGIIEVDSIHKLVENTIMDMGLHNLAREYIVYRFSNMPDIFRKRTNLKPYEYPQLIEYLEAIRHSYWLHSEFSYNSDVQDMKVNMKPEEANIIKRAMLAISQIEVQVKTFWGKIGDKLQKPEIQAVGITFGECHTEGTEILTPSGWVDFKDLKHDSIVMQYNLDTKEIEPTSITALYNKEYEGDIYELKNSKNHFSVTPDHRFFYYTKSGLLKEKRIKDIHSFNSNMKLPYTGILNGREEFLSDMDRLKIAIQADGSLRTWKSTDGEMHIRGSARGYRTYAISVKKERKKERLYNLLKSLDIPFREYNSKRDGYINIEIDFNSDVGDLKTFEWVDLSNKSYKWCEEFIQEVVQWDGCQLNPDKSNAKNCLKRYSSTNKKCIDVVQSIGVCAGYHCHINEYDDKRSEKYKTIYRVSFTNSNLISSMTCKPEIKYYKGNVYCVSVETGCIITRYKNKVLISGNSEVRHADAYSHLLEIMGLNKEFEDILEVPAIKKRISYLEQALNSPVENKDYFKNVILFSMFVENVSLFSQFLIMMSFNKHRNILKGISNAISATQKEEDIHARFGFELVNIIKEENPDWWDNDTIKEINRLCREAYKAEASIVDWIYDDYDLDILPKETVKEYLKHRFNLSLESIGLKSIYDVDKSEIEKTQWFDDEIYTTKNHDFFYVRGTSYSKKNKSFTEEDLF